MQDTLIREAPAKGKLLFEDGYDWTSNHDDSFMANLLTTVEDFTRKELKLDFFENDFMIVPPEDMLDAYTSIAMPHMYHHWAFGQRFLQLKKQYAITNSLAYELVINSNPCLSVNMQSNSTPMMLLVMAHAACGHNHFFKNNYMFQNWTSPDGIIGYLKYAARYIATCEERYGPDRVEGVLDAAHALQGQGVFRSKEERSFDPKREQQRLKERAEWEEANANPNQLLRPAKQKKESKDTLAGLHLPEENILYFLEKYAPKLETWEREILRIVRMIAQYFYPQGQTKVMNEGCATFVHKYVIDRFGDMGLIGPGTVFEMLKSHAGVTYQQMFRETGRLSNSFNPYHLGWKMCEDIRRICENPTDEDRRWFKYWAGEKDWTAVLRDAWANYRDDSFIQQFLSPQLMRDLRMFTLRDGDGELVVDNIHREYDSYEKVRDALSKAHNYDTLHPDIQIMACDMEGDRTLVLHHTQHNGVDLHKADEAMTMGYLRKLWGYNVVMTNGWPV